MNLLSTNYEAIYSAWENFIKSKKKTPAIDQFSYNLEINLLSICKDVNDGSYKHGSYVGRIINEKKRRDIAVATVRDRIVHRLLHDHLIVIWDKTLDPDVYSCRKDKGLHKALYRTQQLLSKHHDSFVWRADVTKFFDSVDHEILLGILRNKIDNTDPVLGLCEETLKSHNLEEARSSGIPIGNLTSQIFSNIYLNEFDRYVRHTLKPQAYVRYGDDFILFAKTEQEAGGLRKSAGAFLAQNLKLRINPKNDVIVRAKHGLKFLGHQIKSDILRVDKNTSKSILEKASSQNIASYKTMHLSEDTKKNLEWRVMQEIFDIIE